MYNRFHILHYLFLEQITQLLEFGFSKERVTKAIIEVGSVNVADVVNHLTKGILHASSVYNKYKIV